MSTALKDAQFCYLKALSLSFWVFRARSFSFVFMSILVLSPVLVFLLFFPEAYLGDIWAPEGYLLSVLYFFVLVLLVALLVSGTIKQLTGDRALFASGEIRRIGLAPPVLLTCILFSLCIMIGFELLGIPGLALTVMWWVAIPAAVVERPGVLRSFSRSLELTRGHRWGILTAFMLVFLVGIAGHMAAMEVLAPGGVGALSGDRPDESTFPAFTPYLIVSWIVEVMVSAFGAVLNSVSYVLLRVEKERVNFDQTVAAFD